MAVNAPEPLKAINQYLKQAAILQKHDPVTAYFCRYHAVQEGVTIRSKSCPNDPAVKKFLLEMFDQLDENKKELGSRLDNGAEQVLSTAMKAFNVADNQDRSGNATKQTAITFLAASVFFSVLAQFGQIPQEVLEKQKYAKWKAADIMNAIKQGKKPKPGSKSDQELEAELDSMPQATGGNESSSVGGADNSLPSPSFPTPPSFSSTSPEATSFNPHNLPTLPSHDSLPSPPPSFPSFPTFPQPPTQTSPNNNYGRGEDNLPPPSFSNNDGYAPMDIPAPSFFQKSDSHSNIPAPFFAPPPSYENNGDDDVPSFPSVPHGSPPRSHFTPDFSKYTLPPSLDNPPPSYSPPSYSPPQNLHQPRDEHNRMQQLQQEQLRRQAEEEDRRRRAEEEERNRRMEEHMRQQQQLQQQQILHQQQLQQQQQQFQQQQQLQQQRMQQQYQQLSPPNPPKANYVPNDDQLELAMKYSKYVTSALQFDDVPTAVKNLKLALKTLTGQEYP